MSDSVLVVGGGIAGIQASLDLADAGAHVVLVERAPTIGGVMAVLDKNFPTLDCSICIEAPKMSEVDLHPNIEILSPAEVIDLKGMPGDFEARIRSRSRFITDECTRCGECVGACPVPTPNEFDSGMATRKAIYTPIPQSVPGAYIIDMDRCLNDPPNYVPCNRCYDVCPPKAIDFMMPRERILTRKVGAAVVAVGYDSFDPREMNEFGYGSHPDVLSALEFERLINSAGPTGGEILCPSDGEHPEKMLFVLCVGSRDERHLRHCSRFCCMYSIKHAYQALDHGVAQVDVLYMDIRAYGKGFDGFWQRTREAGANFVRGRPARISANGAGSLRVVYEDTDQGARIASEYDMVVLANAAKPPAGLPDLASNLGIALDADGFILAQEVDGGLVATTREGVYAAGCVSGPKDIPDSVAEGSGAASLALAHVSERSWPTPPEIPALEDVDTPRVGVFVCHCGSNIAGVVDVQEVVEQAMRLPDVVYAADQMFSCAGNTQAEIEEAIRAEGINRVVVAACSPKTHESIFRGVLSRSALNPYLLEMANIRNMDSWVHKFDPAAATEKAKDMVWMAVEKARLLTPLESTELELTQRVLVVGGGIAGMTAGVSMARQGFATHLVERSEALGGQLNHLEKIYPTGLKAEDLVQSKRSALEWSGVQVHLGTEVESIEGVVGSFRARLTNGAELEVGAVIMATGSEPYRPNEFDCGEDERVVTNQQLEAMLAAGGPEADRITFVSCVGSRREGMGCSRYCCTSMIGQALRLRRRGKQVRVLYKDIRTYGRGAEEKYAEAMRTGVQFLRYSGDAAPEDVVSYQAGVVEVYDHLLGARVRIPTDLLVLVLGLQPAQAQVSAQLKLAHSEDGFLMELHPKLGPAETASQGIYLAGSAQGPKDVRESMAQALAAAGKAGALLARGVIEKEPLTAVVDPELCIGCMRCIKACPFGALEATGPVKEGIVRVLEAACMGCGTCAAECNFAAIDMPFFTRAQILAQVEAALCEDPGSKCVVFTCNWCSYAGADLAGIEKRQYPTAARIVRTMCSARFEEEFIAHAFELGAGAVLVTGCRLTETGSDCHYNYANRLTEKRFRLWQRKYARKGIDEEQLQLQWVSAAEGKEFAEKIGEMDQVIQRRLRTEVEANGPVPTGAESAV